jgi:hypothetical protein
MRHACVILLAIGLLQTSAADQTIEWSQEQRLSWQDFTGSVPRGADEIRVAATTASLPWSYRYTVVVSGSSCHYTIAEIQSSALFHPDASWVRPGHATDAVLEHEQGHFDITQIFRQRFSAATADQTGREHECRGRTRRRAAADAERDIAERIGTLYDDTWRRYRAEQERYDAETRHGMDAAAQARWTEDIGRRLQGARAPGDSEAPAAP